MFSQLSHMMLYAFDIERAVRWYEQHLGFVVVVLNPLTHAVIVHPETKMRIDLTPAVSDQQVGNGAIPCFPTASIETSHQDLKQQGVNVSEIEAIEKGSRFAKFTDSEGNILALVEQLTHDEPSPDAEQSS